MKISTVFFVISSMPYLLQLTLSCDPNQILIEGKCVTIKYMPGCREYYPDGNCKYCQIGKDLVIGRFCVAHPYEDVCCPKVDQEGNCLECVNQLSLVDKVCMLTTIVGCIKKDENNPERCETCGVGYVTRSGKCDINSVGCAVQDAVKGCLFCKPDFHFKDDKCVPNSV